MVLFSSLSCCGFALSLLATSGAAWATTNWVVHVATTNSGHAQAQALPAAPASPTSACTSPASAKTVKVSWTAVTHATSYAVYESTTTADRHLHPCRRAA